VRHRLLVTAAALVLVGSAVSAPIAHAAQTGGTPHPSLSVVPSPTTSPAPSATTPGRGGGPWPWPTICTEASLQGGATIDGDRVTLGLSGWIRPCPGWNDPGAHRSVVLYGADSASRSQYVYPILDPQTHTYDFAVSGTIGRVSTGPFRAACLIDGHGVKVYRDGSRSGSPDKKACVSIDLTGTTVTVAPIAITDPRVAALIPGDALDVQPDDPHCGNCL